jgi:hypothetical protein
MTPGEGITAHREPAKAVTGRKAVHAAYDNDTCVSPIRILYRIPRREPRPWKR